MVPSASRCLLCALIYTGCIPALWFGSISSSFSTIPFDLKSHCWVASCEKYGLLIFYQQFLLV